MHGASVRTSKTQRPRVFEKALAMLLSLVLVTSLTPAYAWAQDEGAPTPSSAESTASGAEATPNAQDVQPDGEGAQDDQEVAQPSSPETSQTSDAQDGSVAAPSNSSSSVESAASAAASSDGATAASLASDSYVMIQDAKNLDDSHSSVKGELSSGCVLWANVYNQQDRVVSAESGWTYQWMACATQSADTADYEPIAGQTSQSLKIDDALAAQLSEQYIAVTVTDGTVVLWGPAVRASETLQKDRIPGPVAASSPRASESAAASATTYAAAAVELYSLMLDKPAKLETGTTLTAHAYAKNASGWGKGDEVTEGVTFAWKWTDADPTKYGSTPVWHAIEGVTGNTLSVTDEYAGRWIVATATAGVNEVPSSLEYAAVGPYKKAGTYTINGVTFTRNGATWGGQFKVGETVGAVAKEKDSTGAYAEIPASALAYTWQISDAKSGPFTDLTDENAHKASFAIPAEYAGKYLQCVVTCGDSSKSYKMRKAIAASDAVKVKTVTLSYEGQDGSTLAAGTTVAAHATDDAGNDVTGNAKVAWSWYTADSSYASAAKTKIEGASGNTFTVPADDASYLGKYIFAAADGGTGIAYSSASKPVAAPGAVELHSVEATGTAKVGLTLNASAKKVVAISGSTSTVAKPVDAADTVAYQWQYAKRNTTSDSAFIDIAGATSSSFEVPAVYPDGTSSLGTYVRVKATSVNSVVSTQKPYYGSTQAVEPLGPVTEAGVYELSSVTLSAMAPDTGDGQGFQVGNTIVPQAMVADGSYNEKPAPVDANLTYTWCKADAADAVGTPISQGYDSADGRLTLTEDLKGSYLYVTVSSGDNTVSSIQGDYGATYPARLVVGTGEYELLRVTTTPQAVSSTVKLSVGDSVRASVQARSLSSVHFGDTVTNSVSVSWYISDTKDGSYTELTGIDGSDIVIPEAAAGKYLKVVATSGASSVEAAFANPVMRSDSLEALVHKLDGAYYAPQLAYDEQGCNVNDIVAAKAAELGFDGVRVRVKSVAFSSEDPAATVGISAADDETNGSVTYFFMDPEAYAGFSMVSLQQAKVTFELSRNGETIAYSPKSLVVPWDEAKLATLLASVAKDIRIEYAAGDSAASVTSDMTLPYRAGAKSKYAVEWLSDSAQVSVNGYGWSDYTAAVTRTARDAQVNLTARVSLVSGGPADFAAEQAFSVTVKGDPAQVEAAKAELAAKLDAAFVADAITYSEDGSAIDASNVTGDIALPNPRKIGVDGKYFAVSYAADTDAIQTNGYRGNVYRGLPGSQPSAVRLTATVTDKANPEITASKTIELTVAPLVGADIDAEVALMEEAKAGYALAILNGQDAAGVVSDLHAFQKAYRAADGSLAWSYSAQDTVGDGIKPVELEGASELAGYRLFKSSDPLLVTHENLRVAQPQYNTQVTVSSCLESEQYARYAKMYAGDAEWGAKLAQLAGQSVSATFTVLGTAGAVNPEVTATLSVIGADETGASQVWAAADSYTLATGSTAAALSEAAFKAADIMADYGIGQYGFYLNTITSPFDGRVLGWDQATGKYWQLFVNGVPSETGASDVVLKPGDSVVWCYSAYGDTLPDEAISVSAAVYGESATGQREAWAPSTKLSVKKGATAAELSEALFAQAGLKADCGNGSWGWFLNTIASPFDGRVLGWDQATGKYWQLFVNGEWSQKGAGDVVLKPGDRVEWLYAADGGTLPGAGDVVVDPSAPHPEVESSWPGFMTGNAAVDVPEGHSGAPTGKVDASWQADFSADLGEKDSVSEPIIVDGKIFVAAGSTLHVKDAATGAELARGALAAPINSIARMVYAKGMVIVPLSGGRLQALSATPSADGVLSTVWVTEKLPATTTQWGSYDQQSLSTLTLDGDFLYYGTTDASSCGYLVCVNVNTGKVEWKNESKDTSFYWSGVGIAGDFAIIGADDGSLRSVRKTDGVVVGTLSLSKKAIRSTTVIAPDGKTAYVVSTDGVLHRIEVAADGTLAEAGSVKFANSSTSTPMLSNGKIFVGGQSADKYDQVGPYMKYRHASLCVIDAATLVVEKEITSTLDGNSIGGKYPNGGGTSGDVKSMPLVVNQNGQTYVYFTSNMKPGGVYCYRVGDDAATLIYEPAADNQEYTMASIVMGPDGALYYVNDSKTLFALPGVAGTEPQPQPQPDPQPQPQPNPDSADPGTGGNSGNAQSGVGAVQPGNSVVAPSATPLGGAVAPGARPLANAIDAAAQVDGATSADASDDASDDAKAEASAAPSDFAAAAGTASDAAKGSQGAAGASTVALVGIILGCAGLATAFIWGMFLRRKQRR